MNKLVNLIIIFLCLRFIIPLIFASIDSLSRHPEFFNLFAGVIILIIQISYNLWLKYSNRKDITLKETFLNGLFHGLVVTTGYYILDDIKTRVQITTEMDDNTIRASFIIFIFSFFILTNCLLSP